MKCQVCGHPVEEAHQFCGSCGAPLDKQHRPRTAESVLQREAPEVHRARLRLVRGDASGGFVYHLQAEQHPIGRGVGPIDFPDDESVSPHHATVSYRDGHLWIRDEGSLNGVYLRLRDTVPIQHGEVFLCGEQVLRFECVRPGQPSARFDGANFSGTPVLPWRFRVVQILEGQHEGVARCSGRPVITLGREDCDMAFAHDRFMSRYHARVEEKDGEFLLRDLDSRNGTYFRIKEEVPLSNGDQFFIGRQLLKVEFL